MTQLSWFMDAVWEVAEFTGIHAGPAGHYDLSEADLKAVMSQVEVIVQDLQTQIRGALRSLRPR